MPYHKRIAILVLVLMSACSGAPAATQTAAPTPTVLLPTATSPATPVASAGKLIYAEEGKSKVGTQSFTIPVDKGTIDVAAYYPVQNHAPDTAHGPYPLLIFSPGLDVGIDAYIPWLMPVASHGFVILGSTPRGESILEFWAGAANRPLDLQRVLRYADELNAKGGKLEGMIDTNHIAVAGHSSGGWTALIGGGAQMNLSLCDHPDMVAKFEFSNCQGFVPHKQEIAAMLGLKSAPEGMWPQMNDPRVQAVIALSPGGDIWGAQYEGAASMKVPTLIIAGSADVITTPELCADPIYRHLGSARKSLAMLGGADHTLGGGIYEDQVIHLMTAFLLAELKGDAQAASALSPANVTFSGVKYETTAYTGK